jgi:hypothetical protein
MEFDTETPSAVRDTAALMRQFQNPSFQNLPDGSQVLLVPEGLAVVELKKLMEPYRTTPERKKGTVTLHDVDSFIAITRRYADADTAIFAVSDPARPSFTAVYDYNQAGPAGSARFGQHRGAYAPKFSDAWLAWEKIEQKGWLQGTDLAKFLMDHKDDVVSPPPTNSQDEGHRRILELVADFGSSGLADRARLIELSRGMKIKETAEVTDVTNLATGETELVYRVTQTGADGEPLKVPVGFLSSVPVFDRGARYLMVIRLSFRREGPKVFWHLERYRPDLLFNHAYDELVDRIITETAIGYAPASVDPNGVVVAGAVAGEPLALYRGTPEA